MRTQSAASEPGNNRTPYEIRAADGTLIAYHIRIDGPDSKLGLAAGEKTFIWSDPEGRKKCPMPTAELPLYGINELDDRSTVVLVEGEKARDALKAKGIQAVATVGGAQVTPSDRVLADLTGRTVILWADADADEKKGPAHMRRIGERLLDIVPTVNWITWDGAPDGGDAYNAVEMGVDIEQLIADAAPFVKTTARCPSGIDAADLLALDLPPLRWIVPDLLPEGTTILAAPPKIGKSCLVYQLAVEVAVGGSFLGRDVEQGSALYLALEDGKRRGQARLRAALGNRMMPRGRLEVRWASSMLGEGLEEEIAAWLDEHPDARFVAIDTLQKVRPRSDPRRNAYAVDVADLARLQDLFRDRPVALVTVHHARKAVDYDFLDSVSGTYGISGSADTVMVVKRKRQERFGKIIVTGRDVPEAEVTVQFDSMLWSAAPDGLPDISPERAEVYEVIAESQTPVFPKAVADQLGLERTNVQHMIGGLVADGLVRRIARQGYLAVGSPYHSSHSLTPLTLITGE